MKLFLLFFLSSTAIAVNLPTATRAPHPYEFVRSGNTRRVNDLGSKAPHQLNRLKPPGSNKKASGVPPYAVLMEPLVKYSQPDPLYNESKEKVSENKSGSDLKKSDIIKKDESKDEAGKQISSKTGHVIEDSEAEGTRHIQKQVQYGTYYEGPIYEEPEPIIEIIIKESNESLPTPPPITTTTQKRKKEPVQVFFVKYKKDPSALYGEEKIVYDAPVPAITPPTNNADPHDYDEEEHPPHHEEFHGEVEEVTLPPRPSTTLKAIIKPDSEIVHGSSLHITFGKPKHGGDGHGGGFGGHGGGFGGHGGGFGGHGGGFGGHGGGFGGHGGGFGGHGNGISSYGPPDSHHRGDHEEQSAPKPSIALPPKKKPSIAPRASSESQLTKRNPAPFHSQTQPPQQSFHNGPSFSTPREFHRPTPPPTFQQTPQFAAQPFKPQLPQIPKFQPNHPAVPPTPPRPSPTHRYSTLPQHLQQQPKPQQSFPSFPPVRHNPPPQQPTGATQQYYSINQPHLKASFHVGVRPTPPQQYHTISSQASQQNSFLKSQPHPPNPPPPVHHQHSKPVPQPLHALPQQTNSFSQVPNSFGPPQHSFPQSIPPQTIPGPLIQRPHQGPVHLPQNPFQNRGIFPPPPQQHQPHQPPQLHQPPQHLQQQQQQQQQQQHQPLHQQSHHQLHQQSHQQVHQQIQQQQIPQQPLQHQHQHQVEQLNRLQQQQQRLQSQILQEQQNQFLYQQKFQTTYAPEIIKSVSPDISFTNHRFELKQPQLPTTTPRPQFVQNVKSNVKFTTSPSFKTTTESFRKYPQTTTPPPVEYVTEDPKKAEEERRKKEERKKANVAALPKEVPDDLREQLLSSGILGNADIQILDYDKIGDIPIENLPPHALANFQAVAGSEPVPSIVRPDSRPVDAVAEASEQSSVVVSPNRSPSEVMEMKVVRYNPESKEGAQVPNQYVKEGATQLEPVVLNDSKYNRYLPLKVAGAQFPVPDVPELRGKNVTSVVVLAPVDYEFLQRHDDVVDTEEGRAGRRSSHPVLEVQGVHFVAGDVLKTLVKTPTSENYRKWLDKENRTSLDKQSVVLLVIESRFNGTAGEKEIFMYDIGTQKVNKLNGELSAQFVEVAESNSENDDLEEISDSKGGGDFTVKDTAQVHTRTQRKAIASLAANIQKKKSVSSPR